MQNEAIRYLIQQYLSGQLTEVQGQELLAFVNSSDQSDVLAVLKELMQEESHKAVPLDSEVLRASLRKVLQVDKGLPLVVPVRRLAGRPAWWAAAAVFVVLGASSYFMFFNKTGQAIATAQAQAGRFKNDVGPGSNKAILTLSSGQQIILDSAANGVLARQGNAQVQKSANGQLSYSIVTERPTAVLYNTLTTPRGGVYQLVLPDGSKVWLNSESSIKYPVFFTGQKREVEIIGEAYFEVFKDASKPFIVSIPGKEEVEVLGTSFNVNAYTNESDIKTTLLEGSVKIKEESLVGLNTNKGKLSMILTPGQQSQLVVGENTNNGSVTKGQLKLLTGVDLEAVVAWKNGLFSFNHTDLQTVMRQLARWYDVDVVYEGDIQPRHFGGKMERDLNLSEVLAILKETNVHFSIEGKKLIVTP